MINLFYWGISILSVTIYIFQSDYFHFNRMAIADGEIWRLFTTHFVHFDLVHLVTNLGALWILVLLFKKQRKVKCFTVFLLLPLISVYSYFIFPETNLYFGMSALIHGLFAVYIFKNESLKLRTLLFMGLVLKLIFERCVPSSWNFEVAYDIHLAGVVVGLLIGFITRSNLESDIDIQSMGWPSLKSKAG